MKYMSLLIEALPWNLLRFASLVSCTVDITRMTIEELEQGKLTESLSPKYMSLLMLLALPNFLAASSPTGPEEGAGDLFCLEVQASVCK